MWNFVDHRRFMIQSIIDEGKKDGKSYEEINKTIECKLEKCIPKDDELFWTAAILSNKVKRYPAPQAIANENNIKKLKEKRVYHAMGFHIFFIRILEKAPNFFQGDTAQANFDSLLKICHFFDYNSHVFIGLRDKLVSVKSMAEKANNYFGIACVLTELEEENLLDKVNCDIFFQHPEDALGIAIVVNHLRSAKILTLDNINLVLKHHRHAYNIAEIFDKLIEPKQAQTTFNKLIQLPKLLPIIAERVNSEAAKKRRIPHKHQDYNSSTEYHFTLPCPIILTNEDVDSIIYSVRSAHEERLDTFLAETNSEKSILFRFFGTKPNQVVSNHPLGDAKPIIDKIFEYL